MRQCRQLQNRTISVHSNHWPTFVMPLLHVLQSPKLKIHIYVTNKEYVDNIWNKKACKRFRITWQDMQITNLTYNTTFTKVNVNPVIAALLCDQAVNDKMMTVSMMHYTIRFDAVWIENSLAKISSPFMNHKQERYSEFQVTNCLLSVCVKVLNIGTTVKKNICIKFCKLRWMIFFPSEIKFTDSIGK